MHARSSTRQRIACICLVAIALSVAACAALAESAEKVTLGIVTPALSIYGARSGDYITNFGREQVPAVGDLNDDGVPDIAIATPWGQGATGTSNQLGEAYVLFGPFPPDAVRDLAAQPPEVLIYGRRQGEGFGSDVLVADLNQDGVDDLVVGHSQSRRPDPNDSVRGAVDLFFGPLSPVVIDLASQEPDLEITGLNPGDNFGNALESGDVNGDGVRDLIVTAATGTWGDTNERGTLVALFGPFAPGPLRQLSVTPPDILVAGGYAGAYSGGLAVADVSGDGIDDILLGGSVAQGWGGAASAGRVAVVFGGLPSGTVVDLATAMPDVIIAGADAQDHLGRTIAAADLTGDGVAELITSAEDADGPGETRSLGGEAYVFVGPLAPGVVDLAVQGPDVTFLSHPGANLGWGLDARAVPGGGRLLLGAPNTGRDCSTDGLVYVVDELPPSGTTVDLLVDPPTLVVATRLATDFGVGVVLADLTGDGWPETIASAAPTQAPDGRVSAGGIFVVPVVDRCEEAPAPLDATGLRLRRDGDDVLLDFSDAGLGVEGIGVDVFKGTVARLHSVPRYDHVLVTPGCGLRASPARDAGGAAIGTANAYYLATRGCPDACANERSFASLGSSTLGVARPVPLSVPDATCP